MSRRVTAVVRQRKGQPHRITGVDRGLLRGRRDIGGQLIAPKAIIRVKRAPS